MVINAALGLFQLSILGEHGRIVTPSPLWLDGLMGLVLVNESGEAVALVTSWARAFNIPCKSFQSFLSLRQSDLQP